MLAIFEWGETNVKASGLYIVTHLVTGFRNITMIFEVGSIFLIKCAGMTPEFSQFTGRMIVVGVKSPVETLR